MLVLAILAIIVLATAALLVVLFIAIVIGIRQAHPTDLALAGPTFLAAIAARVLGLYVRRREPESLADPSTDRDRAAL
jgi:hypothetical protein